MEEEKLEKKKKSGFNFNLKQFFGKLLQNFAMFVSTPAHFFSFYLSNFLVTNSLTVIIKSKQNSPKVANLAGL